MEHVVNLEDGDSLTFKFAGAGKLSLTMSYEQIWEAALQHRLYELQQARYRQNEAQNFSGLQGQIPPAQIPMKW